MECKGNGGNVTYERQIQLRVLQLLQQVGPTNYNILILQFDFHNGYVQGAVDKLLQGKHIDFDSNKMLFITESGYRLLTDIK